MSLAPITYSTIADRVLKSETGYLGLCDHISNMNQSFLFRNAWNSIPSDDPLKLFRFNDAIGAQMHSGNGIAWVVLLPGIFRLQMRLYSNLIDMPALELCTPFVADFNEVEVNCPSGTLGWVDICVSESSAWLHLAHISPGRYLFRMTGIENSEHSFLSRLDEYPATDEDWTVHLCPISI